MDKVRRVIKESLNVKNYICNDDRLISNINKSVDLITNCFKNDNKLLFCGNGGSAADAQHLAAEFLGRFTKNRAPHNSIALTTDTSTLTCIANDFPYDDIFSRQIDAIGNKNDVLIAISTSGNSKNLIKAINIAKKKSIKVICLLGKDGGRMKHLSDIAYVVKSSTTA